MEEECTDEELTRPVTVTTFGGSPFDLIPTTWPPKSGSIRFWRKLAPGSLPRFQGFQQMVPMVALEHTGFVRLTASALLPLRMTTSVQLRAADFMATS